ncbi:MAG: hypothetical protein RJA07_2652 [Bacteroidota bacterium]
MNILKLLQSIATVKSSEKCEGNNLIPKKDFAEIHIIFSVDEIFRNLITIMQDCRDYFSDLGIEKAIDEIVFWLYRTNISCVDSGLICLADFRAFAFFLLKTV